MGTSDSTKAIWYSLTANLLTSLIAMLTALLLAEFVLRLFLPQPGFIAYGSGEQEGLWRTNQETGYRYTANYTGRFSREDFDTSVSIDAQGNRIDETQSEFTHNYHMLAVGDSITFGWGVEANEAWPAVLANSLKKHGPPPESAGMTNAGTSGYNVNQMTKRIHQVLSQSEIDIIVLAFYAGGLDRISNPYHLIGGSFVRDDRLRKIRAHKGGYLASDLDCPAFISIDLWLSEHFYFGALAWKLLGKQLDDRKHCGTDKPTGRKLSRKQKLAAELSGVTSTLAETASYLQVRNIEFIVMLIVSQDTDGSISKKQRDTVNELERQLASHPINIFNSLPLLSAAEPPSPRFRFKGDEHWNKAAHALIGRALADYIRDNNLIDSSASRADAVFGADSK
jgi:lysophospholipase L1-like esterase